MTMMATRPTADVGQSFGMQRIVQHHSRAFQLRPRIQRRKWIALTIIKVGEFKKSFRRGTVRPTLLYLQINSSMTVGILSGFWMETTICFTHSNGEQI